MKNPKVKNVVIKKAKPKALKVKPKLVSFKIAEHKHTGRLIHHNHTSHIALVGLLLLTGFFLYANKSVALAEASSSVSVSVIVPGPAPVIGAVITTPKDGDVIFDNSVIDVKGTCAAETFIVIKSNDTVIGSTLCGNSGVFDLKVQLLTGSNNLSALNYDNLNQPGPTTSLVKVTLKKAINEKKENSGAASSASSSSTSSTAQPVTSIATPVTPSNPSIIPGVNSTISTCSDYKVADLPIGGEPHVSVVCVPRLFEPKLEQVLGVIVWGGTPPYAISVNWGDGSDETLISLKSQSYKKETFSYKKAGDFNITFKLKDSDGNTAIAQTAVQVNGTSASATAPISSLAGELMNTSWLKTPVPFYVLAVAVTFGFWGGDIFDRHFGAHKPHSKHRKIART